MGGASRDVTGGVGGVEFRKEIEIIVHNLKMIFLKLKIIKINIFNLIVIKLIDSMIISLIVLDGQR